MNTIDLTDLRLENTRKNGVSVGRCFKCVSNGYYYKCSEFFIGQNAFGDESINEVICSRLFQILGIPVVKMTPVHANVLIDSHIRTTWLCRSRSFRRAGDTVITLEDWADAQPLPVLQALEKAGFANAISKILVADFLVIQRDRHGANIEFIQREGRLLLAPLFDNGFSLLAPNHSQTAVSDEAIRNFDIMKDRQVNNYIGTRSLHANLSLLSAPVVVRPLRKEHRKVLMAGLGTALPKLWRDKIWEIIITRYEFLLRGGYIREAQV